MNNVIYDLNKYSVNERNGTYGGKAGDKEGITIDGNYWIVKYPKTTKGIEGDLVSYMTAPLSEYIGSHIYQILGMDVHETILGVRNEKLVVACKDFCKNEGALREIRTVKNAYNKHLSEKLNESFSSTSSSHMVDINELLIRFKYNPILKDIQGIEERFWDLFIVDILINNNDRNDGNWGLLYEDGKYRLAPIFDNGAAFSNKLPDKKLEEFLSDDKKMENSTLNTTTIFGINGKSVHARDILKLNYQGLNDAIKRVVPKIQEKMDDIRQFILNIPTEYNNILVCSDVRKNFYIKSMELRLNNFLIPALKKNSIVSLQEIEGNGQRDVEITQKQGNRIKENVKSQEKMI